MIQRLLTSEKKLNRVQLSRIVCDKLLWHKPDGRLKEMSCRVALLRMEKDGLFILPAPLKKNGNGKNRPSFTKQSDPQLPFTQSVNNLGKLSFFPITSKQDSSLYNELIARYHYLGYKPLPGAQLRYMVKSGSHLLAVLGFSAAAWSLSPRDIFIGWTKQQRTKNLHLVVNNARFLILPWVHSQNLASHILASLSKQLPDDWQQKYGYKPVLLETFVQKDLFPGTCYRAANWVLVGQTKGRGKLDWQHLHSLPVKNIFLYPLDKYFREKLCSLP
jgi:hypothetical protein